jgi:hypothetical protein
VLGFRHARRADITRIADAQDSTDSADNKVLVTASV